MREKPRLNQPKKPVLAWACPASTGLSNVAQSAGVSESAMKAEKPMDMPITAANWR
ncbi:hypothetical protein Y695_02825 [Hydrogenophaga sp. T4]|nr:hypothetical protein Y695_02825 [Hydrogenophaga sp. T4]